MNAVSVKATTAGAVFVGLSMLMWMGVYYTPATYLAWIAMIGVPIGAYLFVRGVASIAHSRSPDWNRAAADVAKSVAGVVFEIAAALGQFVINALIVLGLIGLAIWIGSVAVEWLSTYPNASMIVLACLLLVAVILLMVVMARLNDVLARLAAIEAASHSQKA